MAQNETPSQLIHDLNNRLQALLLLTDELRGAGLTGQQAADADALKSQTKSCIELVRKLDIRVHGSGGPARWEPDS